MPNTLQKMILTLEYCPGKRDRTNNGLRLCQPGQAYNACHILDTWAVFSLPNRLVEQVRAAELEVEPEKRELVLHVGLREPS